MDDIDRPDHTDALGRRAAAALRADVERRSGIDGVDDALHRVQHGSGATVVRLAPETAPVTHMHSAWLGAAAAVIVVVIGTGAFLLTRGDDGSRVVPADSTAGTPSPSATTRTTDTDPATTVDAGATTTSPDEVLPANTIADDPVATTPAVSATEVDALAGLTPPAPLDPSDPNLVPALLAPTPVADPSLVRLTGFSTPIDTVTGLHQTWASPDGRILTISTDLGDSSQRFGDVPVDVWPWDDADLNSSMSNGFAELVLRDPSGGVSLWAAGFTDDELVTIARNMTLSTDGWRLDAPTTTELVLLHSGWVRTSFATRMFQWDDDGRQGEVLITIGMPESIRTPYFSDVAVTVVDSINGAPALVTDLPSGSAISWSPTPDVVVVIGINGTIDEVIDLARSMTVVDIAMWDAAGVADSSPADGCNSFFFC